MFSKPSTSLRCSSALLCVTAGFLTLYAVSGGWRICRSRGVQLDTVLVEAKPVQEAHEGSSNRGMDSTALISFFLSCFGRMRREMGWCYVFILCLALQVLPRVVLEGIYMYMFCRRY